jgi:probable F420-dependent oxidoreductase
MRIGIFAPLTNPHHTPDYVAALGTGAEERGFHSLWLGEHVVLFDDYASQYPYAEDGRIPVGGDRGLLDPVAGLGFLAAVTKRIRLGTAICLVPQRNPVYTAKEIASLDYLSGGRIDFGVGIGWLKEEFDALQVPFARRADRTREYLEVIRRLWCDAEAEFTGEFYQLPACRQNPKPVQSPHPPIHFGGESEPALRRVADLGQGWHGFDQTPDQAAANTKRLGELLAERGRNRTEVEISVSPYTRPIEPDELERYRDAGVDQVTLMVASSSVENLEGWLDRLAEDFVVPAAGM